MQLSVLGRYSSSICRYNKSLLFVHSPDKYYPLKYHNESNRIFDRVQFLEIKPSLFSDEAILGRRHHKSENTLLGTGYGWVATPSEHTTTKMVLDGQWSGRNERIRSGHVNTEHAYPHVRILSQSVSGFLFLHIDLMLKKTSINWKVPSFISAFLYSGNYVSF